MYSRVWKSVLDRGVAGVALIVLSPVLVAVALAIRIDDGGPVLFRQQRAGANGRRFTLLKFRSMREGSADLPSSDAHELQITSVGRFIRRANLDELPQLWNILHGEMSFVGPRPALWNQQELIELRSAGDAAGCRPGLTGLAQIKAYDGMPDAEKVAWDEAYARHVTPGRDLGILMRTVAYLTRRPPVY